MSEEQSGTQEFLQRLIKQRTAVADDLDSSKRKRQAVLDVAEEARGKDSPLTDDEDAEFRALSADIKLKGTEVKALDERIADLSEEIERSGVLSEGMKRLRKATSMVESVREQVTYQKGDPRRSYLKDMCTIAIPGASGADEARERLNRHAHDVATLDAYREERAINGSTGTGGYAIPPAWLMDQYIALARAGRPTANVVQNQALPGGTNSINIPKLSTGTTTAIQATQNTSVSETNLTDTSVQANVQTIAGQQNLSIQLIDQSPIAFDEIVFRDLVAAHATNVDTQVLYGSGSNGQVQGIHGTSGIQTYTAGGNTIQYAYAAIANAIQLVHTQRFLPPEVIVMHPRRWGWFLSLLDTTDRPLFLPAANNGYNLGGVLDKVDSQQVVGQMHGLPVVTDPSLTVNNGGSAGQDYVYVMRSSDLILWESGLRTRVLPETNASTLTVLLQVFSYIAFTAGRYPASVVEVQGLASPTWGS